MYIRKNNDWLLVVLIIATMINELSAFSQESRENIQNFESLRQSFASPERQFGSAPLWVWNKDIDSASITAMLQQFKANAFGGVFVHPRAGLVTPYLSDKWFSLYRFTVNEAKRIGLDVWIYDENSYPSGFAGGNVPAAMPSSFDQGQMLELHKMKTLPADSTGYFITLKKENDHFSNITQDYNSHLKDTCDYYLLKKTFYYKSPWYGGYSYVDLMAKGVTAKFIEETMTGYGNSIGDEFGKTVRGIFSDEPNIEVQYPGNIRWTPDLFETFYKKWNYHLETNLPALFEETGDWKKVRHNYYHTLLQLFIDRWSKPYAAYAAEKKLEWTGHYWEHEWPNINHGPDNMAMYAWPQRPGIDMLFNRFDDSSMNAQFGNIRSVKELASVANQLDKKRTLSETYGGGGWELSFKDMKRLGDWEFALGINTLNQHLSFMSIRGARKYDYPQSFSYHTPWWNYYGYLNRYFARLSMALSSGRQINQTLVIEPTTTVWMYYKNDIDDLTTKVKEIGNGFQQFITRLEKSQVEYDLGSENIISDHGKTEGPKFIIGSREYNTVVLPPGIENVDASTFTLLKKYAQSGGRIIQFSRLTTIDGKNSQLLDSFYAAKYPGFVSKAALDENTISGLQHNQSAIITTDMRVKGNLYHYRRQLDEGELIFLANADLQESSAGQIQATGKKVFLMDLFNGGQFAYPAQRKGDSTIIHFSIPPAGSLLLFVTDKSIPGIKEYKPLADSGKKIAGPVSVKRLTDNSLTIDFCDLEFGNSKLKEVHVYDAADTVFKYYGFAEGNPWNTSVQFKDNTIKRDTFSKTTGFTATYYFTLRDAIDLSGLKAVVESPQLYTVSLNGHRLIAIPGKWWLDKEFGVFEIGKYVHTGKNALSVTAMPMRVHAEIEPVYILGNFGLASADKGWAITKPSILQLGSWKAQSLPMYGGAVLYSRKLVVDIKQGKSYIVRLGKWKGTAAVVTVNNKQAAIIGWEPYTCDITPLLKNGSNAVEVSIIGSLKNTLGPHHNKPSPGLVSPWQWRYVKGYPPGKDYDLYDYGLMEGFEILEQKR